MAHVDPFAAYARRSVQLLQQQAGLELVTHIRRVIEQEYLQRLYKGDETKNLHYRIRLNNPIRHPALNELLRGKVLAEQKLILDLILEPHRHSGDMPPYSLREELTTRGYEQHIRVDYDFVL